MAKHTVTAFMLFPDGTWAKTTSPKAVDRHRCEVAFEVDGQGRTEVVKNRFGATGSVVGDFKPKDLAEALLKAARRS